jgi:hypothetical protein
MPRPLQQLQQVLLSHEALPHFFLQVSHFSLGYFEVVIETIEVTGYLRVLFNRMMRIQTLQMLYFFFVKL